MAWLFWRKKSADPPSESINQPELDHISHQTRNAIQGLKLERRHLLSAVSKFITNSDNHIERIEAALRNRGKNDLDRA